MAVHSKVMFVEGQEGVQAGQGAEGVQPTPVTPPEGTPVTPDNGQGSPATPVTPDNGTDVQPDEVVTLVELPDGRKVTPQVAVEEYKRLQGEFTKKTQELAELKRDQAPQAKPWQDPSYQPQTWEEVMQIATEEAVNRIRSEDAERTERERAANDALETEIRAIKSVDSSLDSDAVLNFSNKRMETLGIRYPSFSAAYSDYKFMQKQEKLTEKRVIEQKKQREADPVSAGSPNGAPSSSTEYEPGMSLHEKAQMALKRLN